jgi:hypothetical protein
MSAPDPMRWVWRGIAVVTLVLGWVFILIQNSFNITVPVVVVGLGYLAVVAAVTNLYRVGAAAVAPEDASAEAWSRPLGARGELEREKKTLLKAIKEAEFDHLMGKLSKPDADDLIRMYRARAIEVIKELDRLEAGAAGTAREQIDREVAARLALEDRPKKKKDKAEADKKAESKKSGDKNKQKPENKKAENNKADEGEKAKADDKTGDKADEATADDKAEKAKTGDKTGDRAGEATAGDSARSSSEAETAEKAANDATSTDVEAKEATS